MKCGDSTGPCSRRFVPQVAHGGDGRKQLGLPEQPGGLNFESHHEGLCTNLLPFGGWMDGCMDRWTGGWIQVLLETPNPDNGTYNYYLEARQDERDLLEKTPQTPSLRAEGPVNSCSYNIQL